MESPQARHALYWGSYSYLYEPLTTEEIQILEEAILARRLGRFEQACQLWDERLPLTRTVLVVEKAELEARRLHHRSRLETLETALESQEEWLQRPSEQEINLLTILAAAARIEANGSLRPALLEARKMRKSLQRRPLGEWSLIEVSTKNYPQFSGVKTPLNSLPFHYSSTVCVGSCACKLISPLALMLHKSYRQR